MNNNDKEKKAGVKKYLFEVGFLTGNVLMKLFFLVFVFEDFLF